MTNYIDTKIEKQKKYRFMAKLDILCEEENQAKIAHKIKIALQEIGFNTLIPQMQFLGEYPLEAELILKKAESNDKP